MPFWLRVIFWVTLYIASDKIYLWARKKFGRTKRKIEDKYYLRSLKMRFPDAEDITLIAAETSDAAAMTKIKEQLRDEHRKRVRNRT